MSATATITSETTHLFEELDFRESCGIQVSLLWNRVTDALTVLVVDTGTDDQLEVPTSGENALDVFHHPFAYAALAA